MWIYGYGDGPTCFLCKNWRRKGLYHGYCSVLKEDTNGDDACADNYISINK